MRRLADPFVAVWFGAFFLCAVICTHFDEIVAMPLHVVNDIAAGLLLIAGGIAGKSDRVEGRPYQVAAWAFITSLLFGSVIGNFEEWTQHAAEAGGVTGGVTGLVSIPQGPYLAIVVALFLFSCLGLAGSLTANHQPPARASQ